MSELYRSPLRVYLALAILAFAGIWSAIQLPVSLFPNSAKPWAKLCAPVELSPESFLRTYGESIESQIRNIRRGPLEVETLVSTYSSKEACYEIDFKWGGDPEEAERELNQAVAMIQSRLPQESRDRVYYWTGRDNGGFFAASFYSTERSLTETYKLLEPVLMPKISQIRDAKEPELYNPQKLQVQVELKPEQMANFQLLPSHVAAAIMKATDGYSAGSITMDASNIVVDFPRAAQNMDQLRQIPIVTPAGRQVFLSDVAHLDLSVPISSSRVFKTSGASSVILWVSPKAGGNVKAMSEDIKLILADTLPSLPDDIQYKILVDPSEFIRAAITNVTKEVAIAAGLAVLVLFLFIGNIKNVATAAIEIPLSLILAFILMKISGMNLNLISLGGLALSAGMNVDASVVVMENIFRHFEAQGSRKLSFEERLEVIVRAVKEVQFSVIAATIASLVVFLPLAFTSDLSYAILGDLAKAVVFSHGFSAVVALVLVPTIRLHIMKNGMVHDKPSFFEGYLIQLERGYAAALEVFLGSRKWKTATLSGLVVLMAVLLAFIAPKLPREVIGKPDTDWLMFGINSSGNTILRQMEAQTEEIESKLLNELGDKVLYTFTQIQRVDNAFIMLRLKNKREIKSLMKLVEEKFPNTPLQSFWVDAWNPSELPLPDPPDFRATVRGTDLSAMSETLRDLRTEIEERKLFNRVRAQPGTGREDMLLIRPRLELWPALAEKGLRISIAELADLTRVATIGRPVTKTEIDGDTVEIAFSYPQNYVTNPEELAALPVGVGGRILPLKALAQIDLEPKRPSIRRENGRDAYVITAKGERDEKQKTKESVEKAKEIVEKWPEVMAERKKKLLAAGSDSVALAAAVEAQSSADDGKARPVIQIEDAQVELTSAIEQLGVAVSLSVLLIFLTMFFQFGSIMNALLVLVSVPLGIIGVIISLYVFGSTLSLNSLLGVILLNGLAVANSIILVDFLQRKVREGVAPRLAAVEVGRVRLRPILMTSLTTGLGMLPIALGTGEGGKILQPLGIAVAGGLGFSMVTTLFVVPALQVAWLEYQAKRSKTKGEPAHV